MSATELRMVHINRDSDVDIAFFVDTWLDFQKMAKAFAFYDHMRKETSSSVLEYWDEAEECWLAIEGLKHYQELIESGKIIP